MSPLWQAWQQIRIRIRSSQSRLCVEHESRSQAYTLDRCTEDGIRWQFKSRLVAAPPCVLLSVSIYIRRLNLARTQPLL